MRVMYEASEIARIGELVRSIYELDSSPLSPYTLNAFLDEVTGGNVNIKKLSAGLKLANYLLEHGPTVSGKLRSVIGVPVSQMSILSPYQRGLVDVVGSRPMPRGTSRNNMTVYGAVEGKDELLRRYVSLMEKLVQLVGRENKNES